MALGQFNIAKAPTIENTEKLGLVQQNSLMVIGIPSFSVKFASLGDFIEKDDVFIAQDIIECESGGNHYNLNGTIKRGLAGEIGIAQFMPATWNTFNKIRGTNLDIKNEQDQLNMLFWSLETGRGSNWTCFRILADKI